MSYRKPLVCLFLVAVSLGIGLQSCKTTQSVVREGEEAGPSDELVQKALQALGADWPGLQGDSRCGGGCHVSAWHTVTKSTVTEGWATITAEMSRCFAQAAAEERIRCFRSDGGSYDVQSLGIYRAGVHLSFVKQIFVDAFPDEDQRRREYQMFLDDGNSKALMPTPSDNPEASSPMSEEEFEAVRTVYEHPNGVAKLAQAFASGPIDDRECQTQITPELVDYLRSRDARHGGNSWFEVNMERVQQDTMRMHGCRYSAEAFDPYADPVTKCFRAGESQATWNDAFAIDWAKGWSRVRDAQGEFVEQNIRVLSDLSNLKTTFWMRSSADGRFVGNGLSGRPTDDHQCASQSGFVMDLERDPETGRQFVVWVNAPYDPGFFPDNKGFTFIAGGSAHFCSQELLVPKPDQPRRRCLELDELPRYCTDGDLGVYQHVGASLDGSSYVVVRSDNYANDDGGAARYLSDPPVEAFARDNSVAEFYVFCESGDSCDEKLADLDDVVDGEGRRSDRRTMYGVSNRIVIPVPYEGDFGVAASGKLLTSRIAARDGSRQLGYRLRRYSLKDKETTNLGTVCMKGGKASVSFNERFLVTHHYTDEGDWRDFNSGLRAHERFSGAEDPRFQAYLKTTSNIWIADLLTGRTQRLTFTKPGQFALYPHFRADGWIYFLVRDKSQDKDFVVATDVAIRMAFADPIPEG